MLFEGMRKHWIEDAVHLEIYLVSVLFEQTAAKNVDVTALCLHLWFFGVIPENGPSGKNTW